MMNNISYYNKMSISVYKYLLIISIIIVILGSVYYYKLPNTNSVLKIAIIWFCILMVANLFNMYYILGKYQSNSNKIGTKGIKGIRGPKGFKGKSSTCGMICGSDGFNNCDESEKDENGICQTLADDIDDFGNPNTDDTQVVAGKCIFPFVNDYENQYKCVIGNDKGGPKNSSKHGWCATELNRDNTPKTYGYCGDAKKLALNAKYNEQKRISDAKFEQNNTGITDLTIVNGIRSSTECPDGYMKIDKDLNEGTGGAYVYLCKKEGISSTGVNSIAISKDGESCDNLLSKDNNVKTKKLPIGLNKDVPIKDGKASKLNLCVGYSKGNYLTDIVIKNTKNSTEEGYTLLDTNLNDNTDGNQLYMYYSKKRFDVRPINTACFYSDGYTYFFGGVDGKYYYNWDTKNRTMSSPKLIENKFGRLPNNLDASFTWGFDNKTYFFKGNYVYLYDDNNLTIKEGYPKSINEVFPGIQENIDAVFTWNKDNTTYFFKDKFVYKYDDKNRKVAIGYPRNIVDRFPGAPEKLDAIFSDLINNKTYIIRANELWVLKDDSSIETGYPIPINNSDNGFPGLGVTPIVNSYYTTGNINSELYFFGGMGGNYYYTYGTKLSDPNDLQKTFKNIPPNFDYLVTDDKNNQVYFFNGNRVYLYDSNKYKYIDSKNINDILIGIPPSCNAGYKYNDDIYYFFKGNYVYKYSYEQNKVLDGFPKLVNNIFKGLPSNIESMFTNPNDETIIAIKGIEYYVIKETNGTFQASKPDYLDNLFPGLNTSSNRADLNPN